MHVQIKGLLFDKDGTLFDFNKTWAKWCRDFILHMADGNGSLQTKLAQALKFDMHANTFAAGSPIIAHTLADIAQVVYAALPDRDPVAVLAHMRDSATIAQQSPAVPLKPLLDGFLAHGLKLGIATNDAEEPARAHLTRAGILDHFHFIAGYDSGFGAKPQTGMQLAFLAQTGLQPNEVAMIGDSTHDLHSGREAGMHTIGVLTGPATAQDLAPHADVVLQDIGEIPKWLGHH